MFNFSGQVDPTQEKLFLIKRSSLELRSDPEYYRPRHYNDIEILKQSPYKLTTLDKVCDRIVDGPFGSAIKADDYVEKGVPFIRVADVTRGKGTIKTEGMIYISESAHHKILRSKVVPGDVVIAKTGATMGAASVIPESLKEANIRGDLGALTTNDELHPEYLIAFINSKIGQRLFWRLNSGGTRGRVVIGNLKKYPILIPPIEDQLKIVSKLRESYLNRKIRENEAATLLSSFPLLIAKHAGIELPPLNPRKIFTVNIADIENALNPERYSYDLDIESTWQTLADTGQVLHSSLTPSSKLHQDDHFSYLRIDDLPSNPVDYKPRNVLGKEINGSVQKIDSGDILISRLAPTIENKKFLLANEHEHSMVGSNEFIRYKVNSNNNSVFILGLLRSDFYKMLMLAKSRGATPSRRRLSRIDFSFLPIPNVAINLQNIIAREYNKNVAQATKILLMAESDFKSEQVKIENSILGGL